ncbi:MAG: electron transfer flavoprotein-ubiquinone oxidoreductase [SAR86 cluster bacterium]|nr:electron transfer flavoprotein-ubiquinone oxidoreductase [SAR86 cluster bacterium]MCS5548476.1 electron transfer flavoprotein-ubiquinone oxidoreductase [SAR86 cluster bacterium]
MQRESMEYDVIIVGAGPSGLSAAIKLKQMATENQSEISICIVEKGSEVGAHILSGNVIDPKALNELIPDWKEKGAPLKTEVNQDSVRYLLSESLTIPAPLMLVPTFKNHGNYIISLGNLCRWLAEYAESLEIDIFAGFPASEIIYENDRVIGVITGDMGIDSEGEKKPGYEPGVELRAKFTVLAEGCRGHLGKEIINKYKLDEGKDPQHYGIGFKEVWDLKPELHEEGLVIHTLGWPSKGTVSGSYFYHGENNQAYIGYVVPLDYENPHLSPYDEFQQWKHQSSISKYLKEGKRVSYGARALIKGGLQSRPKMNFPGGLLIGDNAGTLNFPRIKGTHTAMKSGMIAAETIFNSIQSSKVDLEEYEERFTSSWINSELYKARNWNPFLHKFGPYLGVLLAGIDQFIFRGKLPFTLRAPEPDHACLKEANKMSKISYPKPDGVISFDKLSSVFLSNTNHAEDQPCHLILKDESIPIEQNLPLYDEPAQRYCPAGVYEVIEEEGKKIFQINAQNCVHCKTCDIKDPAQNIIWVTPEGTGGPNYPNM